MTKETKNTNTSSAKPSTPTSTTSAPPRKKLTLNTTAFQKKLSSISVNNLLDEEPDYEKMPSLARLKEIEKNKKQNLNQI